MRQVLSFHFKCVTEIARLQVNFLKVQFYVIWHLYNSSAKKEEWNLVITSHHVVSCSTGPIYVSVYVAVIISSSKTAMAPSRWHLGTCTRVYTCMSFTCTILSRCYTPPFET